MIEHSRDAEHIRRAVLAAHKAVVRSLNARSRTAQLKNGRVALGELVTILEVVPRGILVGAVLVPPRAAE